jgi:ubiquinone/menaquinone biosynthesis C-methylase UbiE
MADVFHLPFPADSFDLVTCSNLLFLLSEPLLAMTELRRILAHGGRLAMLNPSEHLSERSATDFAREKSLQGLASATLINWARRAEQNHRWTEEETAALYEAVGFQYVGSVVKMGPGFARFSWGVR